MGASPADDLPVIHVKSKAEWDKFRFESGSELFFVDFWATWCSPCRVMSPVFVQLANQHPKIKFLKVDIDELQDVALQENIMSVPTFRAYQGGRAVDEFVGANKQHLEAFVVAHVQTVTA
ncbi:hypothetical protein KFL_005730030 [Klebsormidium nitens]|uniref:Thioredoxin domain-containing protein n=1 Tax=Klebsormidium nitens TaxID=105231 RepID=A0A0U9HLB8_KLENI|nr:hypothetical protein KFL_005730030 [Klebsormidium nitens]|eukprot:GAQ89882.1 hypothetical protein KFL_005730030 [Klebsormidium nitens]